jgi:ABC-2 type transport system permease protein
VNGARQTWLVAVREMRERGRSRAFLASLVVMVVVVAGIIVLPALLSSSGRTKDIGVAGSIATQLPQAIRTQGDAVDMRARVHRYDTLAAGQQAVRDGDIDVLVVGGRRLEWQRQTDEQLQAVVTGAIQLVAIRDRAQAAGISPDQMLDLVTPVPVKNVELGQVPGRSRDDETAAFIMTVLLFMSIATYGAMVLSGVVEEKASRVVEVLLARMPARSLLAGKVTGIGLLGLGQIALTAVVALVAVTLTDSADIPAVRGGVLAWVVVWFVLGYALYATVFGALGALASRPEDAQSAAGPVSVVLIAGYFVSFAAIGSPDTAWAKTVSFFPATAPLAMPNRIAMGVTAWWEPVLAVAVTVAAIAALVQFGGRVYSGGILHTGPTLKLRDAWERTPAPAHSTAPTPSPHLGPTETGLHEHVDTDRGETTRSVTTRAILIGLVIAIPVAAAVFVIFDDAVIGIALGAGSYAIAHKIVMARNWRTGHVDRHYSHR